MHPNLKTKFEIAYEPNSSTTTRITPTDVGELLATMTPEEFEICMNKFTNNINIFRNIESLSYHDILVQSVTQLKNP